MTLKYWFPERSFRPAVAEAGTELSEFTPDENPAALSGGGDGEASPEACSPLPLRCLGPCREWEAQGMRRSVSPARVVGVCQGAPFAAGTQAALTAPLSPASRAAELRRWKELPALTKRLSRKLF